MYYLSIYFRAELTNQMKSVTVVYETQAQVSRIKLSMTVSHGLRINQLRQSGLVTVKIILYKTNKGSQCTFKCKYESMSSKGN